MTITRWFLRSCAVACLAAAGNAAAAEPSGTGTLISNMENVVPSLGPLKAIILAVAILGIFYVGLTMSLQLSCWFALVETTFKRCAKLTILLLVPTAVAWAVTVWSFSDAHGVANLARERIVLMAIVWSFALLLCGYCTRHVLQCKWRSVVTIYVMFNISANIVSVIALAMVLLLVLGMDVLPKLV